MGGLARHAVGCAIVTLLICLSCNYGDMLVEINSPAGRFVAAVTDNLVHGTLAVLAWLLGRFHAHVTSLPGTRDKSRGYRSRLATHTVIILQSVLCGMVACLIDMDHFISAWSLDFEDAIAAHGRGVFHNSSIVVLLGLFHYFTPHNSLLILIVAFSSHQLRDGVRRGLVFLPLGHTAPLPYSLFLASMALLTLFFPKFLLPSQRVIQRETLLVKAL